MLNNYNPLLQSCILKLLHTHKDNVRNSNIVIIMVTIIHIYLLYRFNYPFSTKMFFFYDFTFYFMLNFSLTHLADTPYREMFFWFLFASQLPLANCLNKMIKFAKQT